MTASLLKVPIRGAAHIVHLHVEIMYINLGNHVHANGPSYIGFIPENLQNHLFVATCAKIPT